MWTSFWCDNCLGSSVCHPMRSIPPPTLSNGRARKGKPAICLLDWILHVCKIESRKLLCYLYTHCMIACTSIHGNEQKERELTQKERKLRQKERERLLSILCYKIMWPHHSAHPRQLSSPSLAPASALAPSLVHALTCTFWLIGHYLSTIYWWIFK